MLSNAFRKVSCNSNPIFSMAVSSYFIGFTELIGITKKADLFSQNYMVLYGMYLVKLLYLMEV